MNKFLLMVSIIVGYEIVNGVWQVPIISWREVLIMVYGNTYIQLKRSNGDSG